jgi:hypothetical protein
MVRTPSSELTTGSRPTLARPGSSRYLSPLNRGHARLIVAGLAAGHHTRDGLWTRDRLIGGSAQLREAVTRYTTARAMLDYSSYTSTIGAELQLVTSELAVCAGFAAHDADHQPLARTLLTEATLLAAGDTLLSARAYGLLALQSNALAVADQGRAREALRFLDMADAAARHEPSPRVHALEGYRKLNSKK